MKVTSPRTLARMLLDRLASAGDPGRALTLAQLLDDHLAYPRVRSELGLAGKGEYDVAILGLLADRTLLQADPALEAAARRELEGPEPALAFADALAERLLRLRNPALPGGEGLPDPAGTADVEVVGEDDDAESELPRIEGVTVEPEVGAVDVTGPPIDVGDPPEAAEMAEEPGTGNAGRPAAPGPSHAAPSHARPPEPEPSPPESPAPAGVRVPPCRSCGEDLPSRDGLRYCPYCGQDQVVPRCTSCGETLESRWSFCPRCGRTTA